MTSALYTTVGYSQAKIFPQVSTGADAEKYRYGQYLVGNVFYNVGTDFQLGLEYLWGDRVNRNTQKASANCVQALIQFNF